MVSLAALPAAAIAPNPAARDVVLSGGDCAGAANIVAEDAPAPSNETFIRVQHIGDPGTEELAKKAYEEALASPDFLAVAARYSDEGERADKGGDLGWGAVKAFAPSLRETVSKMKKGEISEPVESPFGYHVFKLVDRKEPQQKPFEAVKKEIIEAERAALRRQKAEELVNAVRNSKTVTTYRDNVEKLVTASGGLDPNELARQAREAQAKPRAPGDAKIQTPESTQK